MGSRHQRLEMLCESLRDRRRGALGGGEQDQALKDQVAKQELILLQQEGFAEIRG